MLYILTFIFIVGAFAVDNCPTYSTLNFYSELNCQPVFEGESKCPTSFNCDNIKSRIRNQCYYKGRAYSLGETLPMNETVSNCLAACTCTNQGPEATFTCAFIECPEQWAMSRENCRFLYSSPKQCCATEVLCLEEDVKRVTCNYDGNTYYEGEKFYPKGESCKTCICKPGFQGELVEPFCEKIACSMKLVDSIELKKNCAPVFYGKDNCCPIRWICPSLHTKKISYRGSKPKTTSSNCRFGDVILNQYDIVKDGTDKCECLHPPYVTCFENKV